MKSTEVAALMRELLDSDELGAHDSFFDLGGTSLTALRLIAEIQERFGVHLRLIEVIRNPTADGVARLIEASAADEPDRGSDERHGAEFAAFGGDD